MAKKDMTAWAGFSDGHLVWFEVDDGWGGFGTGRRRYEPQIFRTRKEAREQFQDVRKVRIVEVKP